MESDTFARSADINLSNRNHDMKIAVLLTLALILLLGCTQLESGKAGDNTSGTGSKNITATNASAANAVIIPAANTTDVMTADYKPPELPPIQQFDFSNVTTPNGTLIVYYFHSSECSACNALRPEIEKLEAEYTDVLWLEYDITTQNGRYAYDAFAAQLNLSLKEQLVPQVLVNGTVITDRFHINDTLGDMIKNFTAR